MPNPSIVSLIVSQISAFKWTDGHMARSTRLVILIKNIYTLWGRKRLSSSCCILYGESSIAFYSTSNGYKNDDLPKFPKIHVPTFFGDSNVWDLFYEQFTELIHLRKDVSPFLKFCYLKISLNGEARNVRFREILCKRLGIFIQEKYFLQSLNVDSVRQLRVYIFFFFICFAIYLLNLLPLDTNNKCIKS